MLASAAVAGTTKALISFCSASQSHTAVSESAVCCSRSPTLSLCKIRSTTDSSSGVLFALYLHLHWGKKNHHSKLTITIIINYRAVQANFLVGIYHVCLTTVSAPHAQAADTGLCADRASAIIACDARNPSTHKA